MASGIIPVDVAENITSSITVVTEGLPYLNHDIKIMRYGKLVQVLIVGIKMTQEVSAWFTMATGLPPAPDIVFNAVSNAAQTYPTPLRLRVRTNGILQCLRGEAEASYTVNFTYFVL